jgi:hypothetical protein
MKNLLVGLASLTMMIATSAQAVTTSPVMICHEAIHSGFGVTSVQINKEQFPLIQGQAAGTSVQAILSESSLNQATQVLGQYPVKVQSSAEADAPSVYTDSEGTFKLTVDVHGEQTEGGMIEAILEYSRNGAAITQDMVCQPDTQE